MRYLLLQTRYPGEIVVSRIAGGSTKLDLISSYGTARQLLSLIDDHLLASYNITQAEILPADSINVAAARTENAWFQEAVGELNSMQGEAKAAKEVQLAFLPSQTPVVPGYEFWHFHEAARYVGGDYFDYRRVPRFQAPFDLPSGRLAVAIGDVSGKGMPAALLMTWLSAQVELLVQSEASPERIVERLNRNLLEVTRRDDRARASHERAGLLGEDGPHGRASPSRPRRGRDRFRRERD